MLKLNTILNAGILAASTTFFITAGPVSAQTMTDLGLLPSGTFTYAYEVNADGSVVVGSGDTTNGQQAYRWDSNSGTMQDISAAGWTFSNAVALNNDGSVVVGAGNMGSSIQHSFRWDATNDMVSLGNMTGGSWSVAYDVSGDGNVIVGYGDYLGTGLNNYRAYRWTQAGGMQPLGTLGNFSVGISTNDDGSVVVGYNGTASGNRAFRWDETSGAMVNLGVLTNGNSSIAQRVSGDGNFVVGYGTVLGGNTHAIRWDATNTALDLGTLSGGNSRAMDTNTDGSLVVGYADLTVGGNRAFLWDAVNGMQDLGVLAGGTDSRAEGISADGSTIVGNSTVSGLARAFIYRGFLLDLANSQTAIGQSAVDMAMSTEARNAAIGFAVDRELEVSHTAAGGVISSSKGLGGSIGLPMAVRLEGSLSGNSAGASQYSGGVSAAFGLTDQLTLGGFVTAGYEQSGINTISQSGAQNSFGLYLRSRATDSTGLTWKLALASSTGDSTITRSAFLTNTEAGTGTASLSTWANSFELGYGMNRGAMMLTPFLRVTASSSIRAAYTEEATITFPVTYDTHTQTDISTTLGLDGKAPLGTNQSIRFGAGFEADINRSNNPVTGSSALVGMTTFAIAAPTIINAVRGYASLGYSYQLANGGEITLDGKISQSAFDPSIDGNLSLGYEVRF